MEAVSLPATGSEIEISVGKKNAFSGCFLMLLAWHPSGLVSSCETYSRTPAVCGLNIFNNMPIL